MLAKNLLAYLLFALLTAALVLYSHRLQRRFPLPFVRKFFVFITVYSGFTFLNVMSKLFFSSFAPLEIGMFSLLAAVVLLPLQIFVFHSFLRFSEAMRDRNYPPWANRAFWGVQAVVATSFLFTVGQIGDGAYSPTQLWMVRLFIAAAILSLLLPSAGMALGGKSATNARQGWLAKTQGLYFLLAFAVVPLLIDFFCIPFRFFSLAFAYQAVFILLLAIPVPPLLLMAWNMRTHQADFQPFREDPPVDMAERLGRFSLTPREADIVHLVLLGLSNEEIGDRLFISTKTVKNNLTEVYRKLGVKNRVQLLGLLLGRTEG